MVLSSLQLHRYVRCGDASFRSGTPRDRQGDCRLDLDRVVQGRADRGSWGRSRYWSGQAPVVRNTSTCRWRVSRSVSSGSIDRRVPDNGAGGPLLLRAGGLRPGRPRRPGRGKPRSARSANAARRPFRYPGMRSARRSRRRRPPASRKRLPATVFDNIEQPVPGVATDSVAGCAESRWLRLGCLAGTESRAEL